MLALAALLVTALPTAPARAGVDATAMFPVEVVGDTTGGSPADSGTIVRRRGGSARRPAPARPGPGGFEQPRWVMLRSLVLPGWGQLHNHAYLKAVAVAGAEGTLIAQLVSDSRSLRDLDDQVVAASRGGNADRYADAVRAYNARLESFTSREWFLAGVVAYSLLDAYVDAHFRDFELEFRNDRALPEGVPKSLEARLGVRWSF